jgi:hypothetical protein
MDRRLLAGGTVTVLAVVLVVLGSFLLQRDFVVAVLFAALPGGVLTGMLSRTPDHVGAGARAGAYGGLVGFFAFVVIGSLQTLLGGNLSVLVLGVQTILVAVLVVPLHAVLGAIGAAVGVRIRRASGRETAL